MNYYQKKCDGIMHTVKKGDTLYRLSRMYSVSVDDIMEANPDVNVYNMQIGSSVCIPMVMPAIPTPANLTSDFPAPSDENEAAKGRSRNTDFVWPELSSGMPEPPAAMPEPQVAMPESPTATPELQAGTPAPSVATPPADTWSSEDFIVPGMPFFVPENMTGANAENGTSDRGNINRNTTDSEFMNPEPIDNGFMNPARTNNEFMNPMPTNNGFANPASSNDEFMGWRMDDDDSMGWNMPNDESVSWNTPNDGSVGWNTPDDGSMGWDMPDEDSVDQGMNETTYPYRVIRGDTINSVLEAFDMDFDTFARLNPQIMPIPLKPGDTIFVTQPEPRA